MPPSKFNNPIDQMRAEKKKFEKKNKKKTVIGEKVRVREQKEKNLQKERFTGDY
jgi:predicted small lipoprotein YifL